MAEKSGRILIKLILTCMFALVPYKSCSMRNRFYWCGVLFKFWYNYHQPSHFTKPYRDIRKYTKYTVLGASNYKPSKIKFFLIFFFDKDNHKLTFRFTLSLYAHSAAFTNFMQLPILHVLPFYTANRFTLARFLGRAFN